MADKFDQTHTCTCIYTHLHVNMQTREQISLQVQWQLMYHEHIGRLFRMSVLDTEVDGSNPGSSMLFP